MKHALALFGLALFTLPAAAEETPPKPDWSSSPEHCAWEWRDGKDTGLWTEDCSFDTGRRVVAYDAAQDLYAVTIDGKPFTTVLRQFRAAGGPEALAATLQAEGLLRDTAECRMTQVTDEPNLAPPGWTAWRMMPTGALKEAFDKEVQEQIPEPPCGPLGYAVDTVDFFMVKDDAPDRVFFVDLGQERAMLDITTLRLK